MCHHLLRPDKEGCAEQGFWLRLTELLPSTNSSSCQVLLLHQTHSADLACPAPPSGNIFSSFQLPQVVKSLLVCSNHIVRVTYSLCGIYCCLQNDPSVPEGAGPELTLEKAQELKQDESSGERGWPPVALNTVWGRERGSRGVTVFGPDSIVCICST